MRDKYSIIDLGINYLFLNDKYRLINKTTVCCHLFLKFSASGVLYLFSQWRIKSFLTNVNSQIVRQPKLSVFYIVDEIGFRFNILLNGHFLQCNLVVNR